MTRAERCHSGTTLIGSETHIGPAREDGENSRVEGLDEPEREPRLGNGARRTSTARGIRADRFMARTSFPAAVMDYLGAMRPYLSEGTLMRKARNLRTIYRDLQAASIVRAPAVLSEREVEGLILRWKDRGLDLATQAKYLADLEGFLAWCGNPVISTMRRMPHIRLPHAVSKPIQVLDVADLERLHAAAESISSWEGEVARFLVAFLPATGLRRKELRLARLKDLEIAKGRVLVAHPKGEGSWAAADYAPILAPALPAIEDFLAARESYLGGEEREWLVPYRRLSGELGSWSDPMLGQLKAEIARRSGVAFSLKTFRATFAQMAKDRGVPIEAVSRALRHRTTKTTEAYYARIRADDAFREFERAFARPAVRLEPSG